MNNRYKQASDLFSLLAHEPRLRLLDELRRGEACVCHLQGILDRPQAYVSQQLAVLRDAGAVIDRREGLYVYYRLADPRIERVLGQILGVDKQPAAAPRCACPQCEPTAG